MPQHILEEAAAFAAHAHAGMTRKAGRLPYILHPMEAAVIVGTMTNDPEILAAALLHDVVEDAGVTLEQIRNQFGERVMNLVASETENKRPHLSSAETWQTRKAEAIASLRACSDPAVKMLYLGDKLSNLRSIARGWKARGDAFWQLFNQKDPAMHHWYYRAIADATRELAGHDAWQEFNRLIHDLFETEEQ